MAFRLSGSDRAILKMAMHPKTGGVAALTRWYFNIEPQPKQFAVTHAPQRRIVVLAGIRSGKTFGIAIRGTYKCMTIPHYKFLNASISTDQAAVMYWLIRGWLENSARAHKFVDEFTKRPFPIIKFVNGSQMDFRSVGYQAELLRTMEWDSVNLDEAGWVDDYFTVQVLMGRTLGTRVDGRSREGTLSVSTSPTGAPWLREMVEAGEPPTNRNLTIRSSIRENIYLDQEVVEEMYEDYEPGLAAVELDGNLPELIDTLFPYHVVVGTVDNVMNEVLDEMADPSDASPPEEGALKVFDHREGLTRWEMPYDSDGIYVLSADLGTGNIPLRGASAIGVMNIAEEPAELVAWWWVNGGGSWNPGLEAFKYMDAKYKPAVKGIDSTGAQSVLIDVLSSAGIEAEGLKMNAIKDEMITGAQMDFQGRKFRMPYIKAIVKQVTGFKLPDKKIVQDAAMMIFQLLHLRKFVQPPGVKTSTTKRLHQGRDAQKRKGRRRTGRTTTRRR